MNEKTPGQATCEAFGATLGYTVTDWDRKPGVVREAWEAAAEAAIVAGPNAPRRLAAGNEKLRAERDEARGECAALEAAINTILERADEQRDGGDEAAEALAIRYVRRIESERDAFLGVLREIIDTADDSGAYTPEDLREIASKAFRGVMRTRLAREDDYGQEDEADEAKYQCPETSDSEHTSSWHGGERCMACGQSGPEPGSYSSFVAYPGEKGSLW